MSANIERWRPLLVAMAGGGLAMAATWLFDLRVHIGLEAVTGAMSYVCVALGGGGVAIALDHAAREYWPI